MPRIPRGETAGGIYHIINRGNKNKTSGHIWQGRYKSLIVEEKSYYITLIRYIEANALRANLVKMSRGLGLWFLDRKRTQAQKTTL